MSEPQKKVEIKEKKVKGRTQLVCPYNNTKDKCKVYLWLDNEDQRELYSNAILKHIGKKH